MELTEVRVALRDETPHPGAGATQGQAVERRLKAYVTVTFDHCFVVRHIKVIEGRKGLFVAMPSQKPKVECERCRFKTDLGARYCPQCGGGVGKSAESPVLRPAVGETASGDYPAHRDIAHPITIEFRQYLERKILEAYEAERARGHSPGLKTEPA